MLKATIDTCEKLPHQKIGQKFISVRNAVGFLGKVKDLLKFISFLASNKSINSTRVLNLQSLGVVNTYCIITYSVALFGVEKE